MVEEIMNANVMERFDENAMFTEGQTISHNQNRFEFDFLGHSMQSSQNNKRNVVVTHKVVIMSADTAKGFLKTLQENLSNYEKKFGSVKMPVPVKQDTKSTESKKIYYTG